MDTENIKLDLEDLDRRYFASVDENNPVPEADPDFPDSFFFLTRKDKIETAMPGSVFSRGKVSTAFKLIQNGTVKKTFTAADGSIEDYIVARMLNDKLKIVSLSRFDVIFGNISHFITKEPLVIPEGFTSFDPMCSKWQYHLANLVFGTEEPDKEKIEKEIREDAVKMAKTLFNTEEPSEEQINEVIEEHYMQSVEEWREDVRRLLEYNSRT